VQPLRQPQTTYYDYMQRLQKQEQDKPNNVYMLFYERRAPSRANLLRTSARSTIQGPLQSLLV
jgi:hypothetical protein